MARWFVLFRYLAAYVLTTDHMHRGDLVMRTVRSVITIGLLLFLTVSPIHAQEPVKELAAKVSPELRPLSAFQTLERMTSQMNHFLIYAIEAERGGRRVFAKAAGEDTAEHANCKVESYAPVNCPTASHHLSTFEPFLIERRSGRQHDPGTGVPFSFLCRLSPLLCHCGVGLDCLRELKTC